MYNLHTHMYTVSQFDILSFSCVHRRLMFPSKVDKINTEAFFKEPIFIAVESKSPVCDLTNI